MGKVISINVRGKIAVAADDVVYVCGNSDFTVLFDFDAEWQEHAYKTARFITDDCSYTDVVFQGNECAVPVLSNTYKIKVGVFAGNLSTTTPATISAKKSILCGSGTPAAPADDVYAQLTQMIEDGMLQGPQGEPGPQGERGEPGEPGKDAEPYTLPTASATVKGGVKVGNGLRMDGEALGVVPEPEYELIERITLSESAVIKRTQEPDGTPYRFDMLWIHVVVPANNTISNGVFYFYKTSGVDTKKWFLHRWMAATTRTDISIWNGWVAKQHGQYVYVLPSEWDKDGGSPLWRGESRTDPNALDADYPIGAFDTNFQLPAGTVITIKGVRSHA